MIARQIVRKTAQPIRPLVVVVIFAIAALLPEVEAAPIGRNQKLMFGNIKLFCQRGEEDLRDAENMLNKKLYSGKPLIVNNVEDKMKRKFI